MPATRLWTELTHRARFIEASPVTGKGPRECLLDYDLNTVYAGTNSGAIVGGKLDVDPTNNFSFGYNWFGGFVQNVSNFPTTESKTIVLQVRVSDDAINFTSILYTGAIKNDVFGPLIIFPLGSTFYNRFIMFDFWSPQGAYIEMSRVMFGRYYDISRHPNYESLDNDAFIRNEVTGFAGKRFSRLAGHRSHKAMVRRYEMIPTADITAMRNAWVDTRGGHYPMILTDDLPDNWNPYYGGYMKSSRVVRFNHPGDGRGKYLLGETEIAAELFNVDLYLDEEFWAGEGDLS